MTALAAAEAPHLAPTEVMRVAIRYAMRGRRVLALRGKRPITEHGARDGTTDVQVIRRWFGESSLNLGLCLDGLLVVDVDLRSGGLAHWCDLIRRHGEPETLIQCTGTKGLHYLFPRVDMPVKGKPAPGIDVLTGSHRYIVVAPSIHPESGLPYQWMRPCEPRPVPPWLLEFIKRDEYWTMPSRSCETKVHVALFERARRYLLCCEPAISGHGGHGQTFRVALKLATRFPELAERDLLTLLGDWNLRCEPPWSRTELEHKLSDALASVRGQAVR